MSQPLNFDTPDRPVWPYILALLVVWLGFICTASAQTSEEPQRVTEESTCNAVLQMWNSSQLVELRIDINTLQAQALYIKVLDEEKAMAFVLIRPSCEAPWRAVKAFPLVRKKPACTETDSTKCL